MLRPLCEVARRACLQQAAILPIVAWVAQGGHEVAALRQALGQAAMAQFSATVSMAEHDQAFKRCVWRGLDGSPDAERPHRYSAGRRLGWVVQSQHNRGFVWRGARYGDLSPASLAGHGLCS